MVEPTSPFSLPLWSSLLPNDKPFNILKPPLFYFYFFFWSFSISLARWKSAPASWKHCMLLHTHLLKKKKNVCLVFLFFVFLNFYSTYASLARRSWVFPCSVQLPGDGGRAEQRQYFTAAWQAAAKVFTASLQCDKMDPERGERREVRSPRKPDRAYYPTVVVIWQCGHPHTPYLRVCLNSLLCRTMSDRRPRTHWEQIVCMNGCGFPLSTPRWTPCRHADVQI